MSNKISTYPTGSNLKETDLVDVSVDNGDGTFTTNSFTVAQVKAIAENLANADLTQTDSTRQYDIVSAQLLEFINGDLKIKRNATNYVDWSNGRLTVRGGDGDLPRIFEVVDNANAKQFNVTVDKTEIFNTPMMSEVAEDNFDYELGLKGDEVVKRGTGKVLYKARIDVMNEGTQSVTEYSNNTGLTITPSYKSVGSYALSNFNGQLTGKLELTMSDGMPDGATCQLSAINGNVIGIFTYDASGTLADGLLPYDQNDTAFNYCVITVTKY